MRAPGAGPKGNCTTYPRVTDAGYSSAMVAELGDEDGGEPVQLDWTPVRAIYETDLSTLNALCHHYGISREALLARAARNRWDDQRRTNDDLKLLDRLMWAIERLIDRMGQIELQDSDGSKEAAALGRLVTTLDKMIELRERKIAKPEVQPSAEMVELRKRIDRRLKELGVK
jgi:hypothetical protein